MRVTEPDSHRGLKGYVKMPLGSPLKESVRRNVVDLRPYTPQDLVNDSAFSHKKKNLLRNLLKSLNSLLLLSKSVIPSNDSSKPVADQPLELEIRVSFLLTLSDWHWFSILNHSRALPGLEVVTILCLEAQTYL